MKRKGYVVLGISKDKEQQKIVGIIENSFSLNISENYVRVYTPKSYGYYDDDYNRRTYNFLKQQADEYQKLYPEYKFHVYRIGSKHIPIKIDWNMIVKNKVDKYSLTKFYKRNLRFTKKK
ncbi:MAG: hypothetical protein ACOC22_03240 [bacterium]